MGLTAERVRELLDYDPETGAFIWRKSDRKCNRRPGTPAGHIGYEGRLHIRIDGKLHRAYRLAWLMTYGAMPTLDIDHANGDPSDNRLCNLRLATKTENHANSKIYKNNKCGVKGVHWNAQSNKWRVQIRVGGKTRHVGLFKTKEDAAASYLAAAIAVFGEFATNGERSAASVK